MAFLREAVWVALALTLPQRQGSAQQKCPELSMDNTFCNPLDNCTGLVCTQGAAFSASLSVDKCTDPLKIDVSVMTPVATSYYTYTSSGNQTNGGATVGLLTSRNASYVTVQVSRNGDVIIPYAEIPLDPYSCMCESLQSAIDIGDYTPIETDCFTNSACIGLDCMIDIPAFGKYGFETDFEACQNPPALFMVVADSENNAVFAEYFNVSRTTMITFVPGIFFPLSVAITHQDYSMVVQVNITVGTTVYNFLPEQQIILDKSGCVTITPIAPPIQPTGQAITTETCDALNHITISPILDSLGASCQATPSCDALICSAVGFQFYTQLLLCNQPPTVFIQISDTNGVIIQGVLNDSFTFFNLENVGTVEFLVTQTANGISIEVKLFPALGTTSIDLFEEHEIPFDACLCPDVTCLPTETSSSMSTLEPSRSSTLEPSRSSTLEPSSNGLSPATVRAITIPIVLLIMVLVAIIIIVAVILCVLKRRKTVSEQFSFRTMDAGGAQDDNNVIIEPPEHVNEEDQNEANDL